MYCGKCGAKNNDDDNFCTNCGQPLSHIDNNSIPILKKENLLSKDNSEVTPEKKDQNQSKELPTAWLDFISVIWLLAGIIIIIYSAIMFFTDISNNELYFIDLLHGVLLTVTFFYVKPRKKQGYYLFLISIFSNFIISIVSSFIEVSSQTTDEATFIGKLIGALIWFIPNIIYITKRKSLFVKNRNNV